MPPTILVIEDEPQMRRSIVTTLRIKGFNVLEAEGGRAGLETARHDRPDLILCDISMPDLDGHGLLRALRAEAATARVPFIFLTARGQACDVRAGMNLGADDYLPKPFSVPDLLSAIEARLSRVQVLQSAADPVFDTAAPLERLGLSRREADVLLWLAQGKSNAEIAAILDTTVPNVKKHAQHIFDKLGVDNRTSAMLIARKALAS